MEKLSQMQGSWRTDDFENVVCAIEESRNVEEITIDDLTGSLEAHEQRKKKKKQ